MHSKSLEIPFETYKYRKKRVHKRQFSVFSNIVLRILKCGAVYKRDSDLFSNYLVLRFAVKPNAMDKELLSSDLPLVNRLLVLNQEVIDLDQTAYTQSVVNLLIQAGKVANAAGHGRPISTPFSRADPDLMLVEIENLLDDIVKLVCYAEALKNASEIERKKETH